MKKQWLISVAWVAVCTLVIHPFALAQTGKSRATGVMVDGKGVRHDITLKLLPSDGVPNVCGKTLYSYHTSDAKPLPRVFRCDGSGYGDMYGDDTFEWGYALSDTNKAQLKIKTFKEWGWEYNLVDDAAVLIFIKYTNGSDVGKVHAGIIGVTDGKVRNGFGYGFYEK